MREGEREGAWGARRGKRCLEGKGVRREGENGNEGGTINRQKWQCSKGRLKEEN